MDWQKKTRPQALIRRVKGKEGVSFEILPCVKKETLSCYDDVYYYLTE
jgi:hypothetical protein